MKTVLIIGASGMAGQALVDEAMSFGYNVVGASKNHSDLAFDIRENAEIYKMIAKVKPNFVINTAAIVNVDKCENDPLLAWQVNAKPLAELASLSKLFNFKLVQISTDHYFHGLGDAASCEDQAVTLLNNYALTKYAAEAFALTAPNSVVIRTNIVGLKKFPPASFAQWAMSVIENDKEATLFNDQYVSSIDIWSFAKTVFHIMESDFNGVINVAASEVFTKADFVLQLAHSMGKELKNIEIGSQNSLETARPNSMGLDVSLVTQLVSYEMPNLEQVCQAIVTKSRLNGE